MCPCSHIIIMFFNSSFEIHTLPLQSGEHLHPVSLLPVVSLPPDIDLPHVYEMAPFRHETGNVANLREIALKGSLLVKSLH